GRVEGGQVAYWTYAGADAALTARLYERLRAEVADELLEKEQRIAMLCWRAGLRGFAVDPEIAVQLEHDLAREEDALEQRLRSFGIANIATAAGRAAIIQALEREGVELYPNSGLDREVLLPLAEAGSALARDVLALRPSQKFRRTFAQAFLSAAESDGRLHAFPRTCATRTGRMALSGLPLQTVPKGELELQSGGQ